MDGRPITINPEEGKLIQLLIKLSNAKTIIEIGTLYGYSTIWMARALPNDGKIYTIDRDTNSAKIARENFSKLDKELSNKIIQINGDANVELQNLIDKKIVCDIVFIDADKISYYNYLKLSEKLLKKDGLLIADNTFLSGAVYKDYLPDRVSITAQQNVRKFNGELADESKYCGIMLNTEEGLSIAVKKF